MLTAKYLFGMFFCRLEGLVVSFFLSCAADCCPGALLGAGCFWCCLLLGQLCGSFTLVADSCWMQLLFWFCLCLLWHWFELSLPRSLPGVSLHEGCSCYCRFWGACSPVQIVLLCIYSVLCWPPAVLQACLALFDLIYFLHSIKKKKPNDGGNGPIKSIPQQSKISMTIIGFKGIM